MFRTACKTDEVCVRWANKEAKNSHYIDTVNVSSVNKAVVVENCGLDLDYFLTLKQKYFCTNGK